MDTTDDIRPTDSDRTGSGRNKADDVGYQSRGDAMTSTGHAGGGGTFGIDDRRERDVDVDDDNRRTGGNTGGGAAAPDRDVAGRKDSSNIHSGYSGDNTGTSGRLKTSSFGGEHTTTQTFEKSQGHNFNDGFSGRTNSVIDKDYIDQARSNVDSSSSGRDQQGHAGNLGHAGSSAGGHHGRFDFTHRVEGMMGKVTHHNRHGPNENTGSKSSGH